MNEKPLIGHANLVVKKAQILPVWEVKDDATGRRNKYRTGEVVVRVTIANLGKKPAGPSKASLTLIKAQDADFLDTIDMPEIAEGREYAMDSKKLMLKDPGAIVVLADTPVDGHPQGMVREYGVLTTRTGEMDNAFAFPFEGGELEEAREYDNPVVH